MDVLDVDNPPIVDDTTERPELDPDDAPVVLRTLAEDVQDMIDAGVIDGRALKCLAELAAFRSYAITALDAHAKHITDLGASVADFDSKEKTLLSNVEGLEAVFAHHKKSNDEKINDHSEALLNAQKRITELEATVAELETAITTPAAPPPSGAKSKAAAT